MLELMLVLLGFLSFVIGAATLWVLVSGAEGLEVITSCM